MTTPPVALEAIHQAAGLAVALLAAGIAESAADLAEPVPKRLAGLAGEAAHTASA